MTHYEFITKVEYIKLLSKKRMTGNPQELANKLQLSKRTILPLIQSMKKANIPIRYNRKIESYTID